MSSLYRSRSLFRASITSNPHYLSEQAIFETMKSLSLMILFRSRKSKRDVHLQPPEFFKIHDSASSENTLSINHQHLQSQSVEKIRKAVPKFVEAVNISLNLALSEFFETAGSRSLDSTAAVLDRAKKIEARVIILRHKLEQEVSNFEDSLKNELEQNGERNAISRDELAFEFPGGQEQSLENVEFPDTKSSADYASSGSIWSTEGQFSSSSSSIGVSNTNKQAIRSLSLPDRK